MSKSKTSVSSKSEASAQPAPAESGSQASISPEDRTRMIAEAAYILAEQRGFQGGSPEQDWLEAEAQVERMINRMH